jgi:zinc protease
MPECRTCVRASLAAALMLYCLAALAGDRVASRTLENGMRVLVQEDRRAPVAVSMVWYRAGSMDEQTGTTGVAHVLEHMMFKGTREVPPGEFSKTVARAGGRDNAFTNRDYTAYFQQLHASQLSLVFRLEADRMSNLLLGEDEFAKEIRVVMEERRLRTDDQPRALLYETFMAAAFKAHPYRTPVIGWMPDLRNMTVADARAWYERWYTPENATLVVVGDVEAQAVFDEAARWFGPIPARALPPRKAVEEPPQRGERRVTLRAAADLPQVLLGWHVPVLRDVEQDWESYALWVLSSILGGNDAARLPRALVREQRVAVATGASYDAVNRGPGLFVLSATAARREGAAEVEGALRAQLQRVAEHGIAPEELARTRAQAVASQVFQQDSMFGRAMQIGTLSNAGLPPDSVEIQVQRLQEVTAEQVQAVARKFFGAETMTVAVLEPLPSSPAEALEDE